MPTAHEWKEQLDALLAGPYSGRGGKTMLAQELGIHKVSLGRYLAGTREPTVAGRQALARLYKRTLKSK